MKTHYLERQAHAPTLEEIVDDVEHGKFVVLPPYHDAHEAGAALTKLTELMTPVKDYKSHYAGIVEVSQGEDRLPDGKPATRSDLILFGTHHNGKNYGLVATTADDGVESYDIKCETGIPGEYIHAVFGSEGHVLGTPNNEDEFVKVASDMAQELVNGLADSSIEIDEEKKREAIKALIPQVEAGDSNTQVPETPLLRLVSKVRRNQKVR